MKSDEKLAKFWQNRSIDESQIATQHLVEWLVVKTGGPGSYVGKDMKTAHDGMEITSDDWTRLINLLVSTLSEQQVSEPLSSELW